MLKSIIRPFTILLLVLFVSYGLICVAIYLKQEQFIFFPQDRSVTDSQFTTLLKVNDQNIVVSSIVRKTDKALIYLGGNAEDVSLNLIAMANLLPKHSIYMLHYRGYGGSEGEPGEAAIREDTRVLYDHAAKKHGSISVLGRSLGTGFAIMLASEKRVDNLVLITPYASMEDLASRNFPILPVSILLKHKIQADQHAAKITAPTAIFLASRDEVIPKDSSMRLAKAFGASPPTVFVLDEDHNSILHSERLYEGLRGVLY